MHVNTFERRMRFQACLCGKNLFCIPLLSSKKKNTPCAIHYKELMINSTTILSVFHFKSSTTSSFNFRGLNTFCICLRDTRKLKKCFQMPSPSTKKKTCSLHGISIYSTFNSRHHVQHDFLTFKFFKLRPCLTSWEYYCSYTVMNIQLLILYTMSNHMTSMGLFIY